MSKLSKKEMTFLKEVYKQTKLTNQEYVDIKFDKINTLTSKECYDIGNNLNLLGFISFSPYLDNGAFVGITYKGSEYLEDLEDIGGRTSETNHANFSNEIVFILKDYPDALAYYNDAILKFNKNSDYRNLADDLRVSLEVLCKKVLNNEKSLENNVELILKLLDDKGIDKEIRNVFHKILDYYIKYQNSYVKHPSTIHKIEVTYLIEQTSIFMKFLIQMSGR